MMQNEIQVHGDAPIIVVISFLTDRGHVMPLLRLAENLARGKNIRIVCCMAPDLAGVVRDFGFELYPLPASEYKAPTQFFENQSQRSLFYTGYSYNRDLREGYWAHFAKAATAALEGFAHKFRSSKPIALCSDSHVFLHVYKQLANYCHCPLIISRAGGTLIGQRRDFFQIYGLSDLPSVYMSMVEMFGRVFRSIYLIFRKALRRDEWRRTEIIFQNLKQEADRVLGVPSSEQKNLTIAAGLAWLETELLSLQGVSSKNTIVLPPLIGKQVFVPGPDLDTWLRQQSGKPIIYIGFGTMIRPSDRVFKAVLDGVLDAGASVILAIPLKNRGWMSGIQIPPQVLVMDFAPQSSLLSSGFISCFITHAGSGGLCEAIIGEVPTLCIPYLWDQPYAASIVAKLGLGIHLSRRFVSKSKIRRNIQELISNPVYKRNLHEVAKKIRVAQNDHNKMAVADELIAHFKIRDKF